MDPTTTASDPAVNRLQQDSIPRRTLLQSLGLGAAGLGGLGLLSACASGQATAQISGDWKGRIGIASNSPKPLGPEISSGAPTLARCPPTGARPFMHATESEAARGTTCGA